jgi:class 3 adenylate cyclase/CheY-like chemotaxis protein
MSDARTIVMAEDSRLQGMILKKALDSRGFTVHWAANGREALELVRLHRPALVVSDVEMPEMDGHALCRSLKADADLKQIPVLLLTSLSSTADILEGLREGADAYVTKPYDPPHVLERIDHLLAHGQAADVPGQPIDLQYGDETFHLDVSRRQLLNLLLSTYENILRQNAKLEEMHLKLTEASRELEASLARRRDLLYRVFPREIADELADAGQSEPRQFEDVTVLFTDFVGFTRIAAGMSPRQLIDDLEGYFRRFDQLTAAHSMEKLKTIGDAYMAAGGVPVATPTHAVDAALLAIALRESVAEMARERAAAGQPAFSLRIGLHTGPLVAGVIGEQRFTYDLWGDTVNTASRMESGGEPGRINISGATHRLVSPFFECVPRGHVEVKNKGAVEMYFLERLKPEFSADEAGTIANEQFQADRARMSGSARVLAGKPPTSSPTRA